MKHALIALAALPLIAGCQFIPGQPEYVIAQAQKVAAQEMRDPASAKFRSSKNLRTIHVGKEHFAICGEINATDTSGDYVGFRRFFYSDNIAKVSPEIDMPMALEYMSRCLDARRRDAEAGPYSLGLGERVRCERMIEAEVDVESQKQFERDWAFNCGGYLVPVEVVAAIAAGLY